jgi:hypothetical protein
VTGGDSGAKLVMKGSSVRVRASASVHLQGLPGLDALMRSARRVHSGSRRRRESYRTRVAAVLSDLSRCPLSTCDSLPAIILTPNVHCWGTAGDPAPRNVMVVHGRDEAIRRAMFSFLRSIGLHPIEWSEAVDQTGSAAPYVGDVLDRATRTSCIRSRYWGRNACQPGSFSASASLFGRLPRARRLTSAAASPCLGSTPSGAHASSAVTLCPTACPRAASWLVSSAVPTVKSGAACDKWINSSSADRALADAWSSSYARARPKTA